jgi:hypothetical protein
VYISLALWGLEISDRPDDAELGRWTRELHKNLVLGKKGKDSFTDKLISEVEETRTEWNNRKNKFKETKEKDSVPISQGEACNDGESQEAPAVKNKSKPTRDELNLYASEINVSSYIQEQFFDYFQSNGWKVGKNPMKDWKAALRNWVRRGGKEEPFRPPTQEEMNSHAIEIKFNNSFEIAQFANYYNKKGWEGIHDWKAAMNSWANKWKASQNG